MSDLKERIKKANDIQKEIVHVDEWDVDIEVRGMDGSARAIFMETSYDEDGKPIQACILPNIVIATCYDPSTSEKLFDESDASWLCNKNGGALSMLGLVGLRLSGISKKEMGDIKNAFEAGESDDSTSPSQKSSE
jgi:hypothetical protein